MTIQAKGILLGAAIAAFMLPAIAQTSSSDAKPATVQQRKENQQDRIANGVENGQLTAGETNNLERKEAGINHETRDMREDNGGKLTPADRAKINRQQNRLSGQIYRDKHNAAVQNTNPRTEVGRRQRNQQERIGQGIQSGQLTAGETAHLERREAAVNHEIHNERAANGGHLTPAERAQVNRQQNRTSRQIYREKHNGRHQ